MDRLSRTILIFLGLTGLTALATLAGAAALEVDLDTVTLSLLLILLFVSITIGAVLTVFASGLTALAGTLAVGFFTGGTGVTMAVAGDGTAGFLETVDIKKAFQ
jgi:hypothetical protein